MPTRAESVLQAYRGLLDTEQHAAPPIDFSVRARDGSVIEQQLTSDQLNVAHGVPMNRALMDVLFLILDAQAPARVLCVTSLPHDREQAFQWICSDDPPPDWDGLRLIPLAGARGWSLLLARYRGPGNDVYVL